LALGKFVSKFLRRDDDPAQAEAPRPARRSPLEDLEDGSVALEDVLRQRPEALGAILHVITVGKIRELLGAEWPVYAQKIYAIADRLFLRHLGPHGIYSLHEEDTFLFSFGTGSGQSPEEEAGKAGEIATDLMRWLIGDSFAGAEIGVAAMATKDARRADGSIDIQAIATARAGARIIRAQDLLPIPPGEKSARTAGAVSGKPGEMPEWLPLYWPPEGVRLDGDPCLDIALPPGLRLGFRPVWQARTGQTDLVLCEPIRVDPGQDRVQALGRPRDDAAAAALELAVFHAALRQLDVELERRSGLSLVVALSWSSTAGPRESLVSAIAATAPAGARGRHLFLELRALGASPAGIPVLANADQANGAQDLAQTVARLRALSRDVLIDCTGAAGPDRLQGVMPLALGTRLQPAQGAATASRNIDRLGHLVHMAEQQPIYLWGLPRQAELPAQLRQKLILASGPEIGPVAADPPAIRQLSLSTILPSR